MPFADEDVPIVVVPYDATWPEQFDALAARLDTVLDRLATAIDHVGSTSVPGLESKDVIDVQVRVDHLEDDMDTVMSAAGFRRRPESWNDMEVIDGVECSKMTFGPPVGERRANISVRLTNEPNTRAALLFRDFLCANDDMRDAWGAFKTRAAQAAPSLTEYGQLKVPATVILFRLANEWALSTGWRPPDG